MPATGLLRFFGLLYLFLGLAFLAYAVVSYVRRKGAGAVLLDVGPWPYWWVFRFGAVMWLLLAVWQGFLALGPLAQLPDQRNVAAMLAALGASFGGSLLSLWWARRLLTEKGIVGENGVIPWENIASCTWRNDRTVEFKARRRLGSIRWKVAPDRKEAFERILAKRMPRR